MSTPEISPNTAKANKQAKELFNKLKSLTELSPFYNFQHIEENHFCFHAQLKEPNNHGVISVSLSKVNVAEGFDHSVTQMALIGSDGYVIYVDEMDYDNVGVLHFETIEEIVAEMIRIAKFLQ
tara:strand:- start:863 stop:1231 length:369 start_codon:yes stop_codon:yes gene_type:complete